MIHRRGPLVGAGDACYVCRLLGLFPEDQMLGCTFALRAPARVAYRVPGRGKNVSRSRVWRLSTRKFLSHDKFDKKLSLELIFPESSGRLHR